MNSKNQSKNITYIGSLLIAVALIFGLFALNGFLSNYTEHFKTVSVNKMHWTKTSNNSGVSFELCNNRNQTVIAYVYIAVYSRPFDLSIAKGNPVDDLVGEKQLTMTLKAKERKEVKENVSLYPLAVANMVTVKVIKVAQ